MPPRNSAQRFQNASSKEGKKNSIGDKISYVGPILGHGDNLGVSGTAFVYLIANYSKGWINLFLPNANPEDNSFNIDYGSNVRIESTYDVNSIRSLVSTAYKLGKVKSKFYIFNYFPTSLGSGRIKNFIWSLVPIYLRFRGMRVMVIFHNSVSTSDWKSLGYTGTLDKIGAMIFGIVERVLFKTTDSVFLLKMYKDMILKKLGLNVMVAEFKYLDSTTACLASDNINRQLIEVERSEMIRTIHIHGNFGPQKDIELALAVLAKIAGEGAKFRLLITGSINPHFPGFKDKLDYLLNKYKFIISEVIIPISESLIFGVFERTDILILPYRAAGGRSGVMDLGAFFDLDIVVFEHSEFAEQAGWYKNIHLIKVQDLESTIISLIARSSQRKVIDIKSKINDGFNVMENLLKTSME
jgi:glycosyltransferase involved in cell wall biosynthesis